MHWWDGQQEQRLRQHQFALDYVPFINGRATFHAGHACGTLDIHIEPSLLALFSAQYPAVNDFLAQVALQRRSNLLDKAVRFLSPAMLRIVHDILHYNGQAEWAGAYYREQVFLLLDHVLERATSLQPQYSHKKYLEASVAVRQYIEQHPTRVHTGKSLGSYSGLNVSLLHKIFHEYHGTTLFAFSQQLRLDHAKTLLRDTSLYIQQIADECGYPEHANFTIAFRKRFGFTPQQYRDALAKTAAK
jgi:AraC-like DNA-binding protein